MTSKKQAEYTISYSSMCGVDLSGRSKSRQRYAYAENMYRDYEGDGGELIETVPGFRKLYSFGKKIHRIYTQKSESAEYINVHSGDLLYRFDSKNRDNLAEMVPIATLKDGNSRGFNIGGSLYILDGEKILKVDSDGLAVGVGSEGAMPYVPTTYVNGSEYEQLNLLTNRFTERFLIASTEALNYGTYALHFSISDPANLCCSVVGIDEDFVGSVSIPSYKKIGEITYRVNKIEDKAFYGNASIHDVKISEGVEKIGKYAFANCEKITSVRLANSIQYIEDGAFYGCKAITDIYVGSGLKSISENAFTDVSPTRILYPLDEATYEKIEGISALGDGSVSFQHELYSVTLEIKLGTAASSVSKLTVGGKEKSFSTVSENGVITSVVFREENNRAIEGKEAVIEGTAARCERGFYTNKRYTGSGFAAICGCTVCECFDGRVFLSGNPALPNTVFYSARDDSGNNNPLYFGIFNYFDDGMGDYPVTSMLSAGDMLAVFKSGDDGGGSIFYHTPRETESDLIPKIYPVAYIHNGICAVGESISFFDDPLFLTEAGVLSLEKQNINLERSIVCRSHNVNSYLLRENLKKASMAKWQGYLALLVQGSIYLADSRATFTHESGAAEYEWYYLTQIGTFEDSTRVYRYASTAPVGYLVYTHPDTVCDEVVISTTDNNGNVIYYCKKDGTKYALYPTGEKKDGYFSPATVLAAGNGGLLFFGTENGDLCVFNNDKRGIAPQRIASDPEYDRDEYQRIYARRIHPDYYSFDGHAIRCALKTAMDDCSIPHMTKSTVKHSLAIKCRNLGSCNITCEIGTEKNGYSELTAITGGEHSFYDMDFSSVTLSTEASVTLPIAEKEKNWVEKQIVLYTDSFNAPFGVYSITYRFTVKGRIKKS